MAVMNPQDREKLVGTLTAWAENAQAGVQCTSSVTAAMKTMIEAPSDKPPTPGVP